MIIGRNTTAPASSHILSNGNRLADTIGATLPASPGQKAIVAGAEMHTSNTGAATVDLALYDVTDYPTDTGAPRVALATLSIPNSNAFAFHTVAIDIDLSAYAGRTLKPAIGNAAGAATIRVNRVPGGSGSHAAVGTLPATWPGTANDTGIEPIIYFETEDVATGQTLTVPLLSSGNTVSTPDLVQKVTVTTPSYDPASIFYAYTGDTPASPDFFYIRESTFGNTTADGTGDLTQTTSAPVDFNYFDDSAGTWSGWVTFDVADLSVPTLSSGTVLYEMTVQGDEITLSPPLLDSSASLYASTVSATYGLEVPLLDSSASVYAPEVDNGYSISVPLLSATTALFVPEISTTVELAAPLLASELVLYEPTLTSVVRLEVPLLEEETELLAPGVGMFIGISGPLVRVVSGRNYTYKVK